MNYHRIYQNIITVYQSIIALYQLRKFDFSLCKARVYARHCGTFLWSKSSTINPDQIPAGKCEITPASLGMESKALQFHGTEGMILSSKHGT